MTGRLIMESVACWRGGRWLVRDFDLALGAGDALVLVGPNGTGKSSLLRLAAGLLAPAAGRIERSAAALADDQLALDREAPLHAALSFWAGLDGARARLGEAMAAFALEPLAEVPVRMLSTGQARRARLARVMASGAPLWLLDEPLNGLDGEGADRLAQAVARHRAGGGAVLAASHQTLGAGWAARGIGA